MNGKYYFRIAIPTDLQDIVGLLCYKKSLKTSDKAVACQYCRILSNRAEWAFSGIRKIIAEKGKHGLMSDDDLKAAVRSHFEKCLLDGELELYGATTALRSNAFAENNEEADPQRIRQEVRHITQNSERLLDHLRELQRDHSYTIRQESVAKQLQSHFDLYAPIESGAFAELCLMVLRAQIEAEKIKLAYFSGNPAGGEISDSFFKDCRNFFETPRHSLDIDWQKPFIEAAPVKANITLREAADLYIKSREIDGTSVNRIKDIRSFMNKLVEYLGEGIPLSEITKKAYGVDIKEFILRLPTFYQAGEGATLRQIIHDNNAEYASIKPATALRFWGVTKAFFSWCVSDREFILRNPLDGIKFVKPDPSDGRRYGFRSEHLDAIFKSPIFTARKYENKALWERGEPGHIIRDGFFWLPLVALYTGYRESEILSLYPSDIRWDNGILYIDANEYDDNSSLKTEHSMRGLPIHPDLLAMGFAEYCEARKRCAGVGERLFGDNINIPEGNPGKDFTRRFSDYLVKIGLKTKDGSKQDRNLCFHSFRHNYVSAIRRIRGATDEILNDLSGHESGSRGTLSSRARYGSRFSPSELYPYICQIKFDVDLSHLKFKK